MTTKMVKFVIYGVPKLQERPRRGKYGNFYSPSTKEQQNIAKIALVARCTAGVPVMKGRVSLSAYFHGMKKRSDLSNAVKLIEDACNGIIYEDDSQIWGEHLYRYPDDGNPRTEVDIWETEEGSGIDRRKP